MAERKLTVVIAGDTRGLSTAFGSAEKASGGLTSKFKSLSTTAKVAFASLTGGAIVLGKQFVNAAEEAQQVTKQTTAVIKSQGNASKISAKQVGDLADALSKKSGLDDELVQSGENVLLTFRNIRNEVGAGNDIFNQATTATLDMSVALGKDLNSSAIMVGKALNDPIKGMTALSRAGVQFSADQKEAITTMVASGDTLGAQKLILQELTKEFEGSAEAQATATGKLSVAWENVQEQLGTVLLPILDKVATWLTDNPDRIKYVGVVAVAAFTAWAASALVAAASTLATAGPLLLVIGLIAGLTFVTDALWKKFDMGEKVSKVFQWIIDHGIAPLYHWLAIVVTSLESISNKFDAIRDAANKLGAALSHLPFAPSEADPAIVDKLFPKGKAAGGPVTAGTTYLVGERGPELFTAGASGAITPNNKIGGGGTGTLIIQIGTRVLDELVADSMGNYSSRNGSIVVNTRP